MNCLTELELPSVIPAITNVNQMTGMIDRAPVSLRILVVEPAAPEQERLDLVAKTEQAIAHT